MGGSGHGPRNPYGQGLPLPAPPAQPWSRCLALHPTPLPPSRPVDPDWASYKLGIFICLNCSGVHRNFPDISKIKSVRLDFWDDSTVEVVGVGRALKQQSWGGGGGPGTPSFYGGGN